MRFSRLLTGLVLSVAGLVIIPRPATAAASDSIYSSPDLLASSAPAWLPAKPVAAGRAWETALRLPGRIASLPLVAMGNLAERSLLYLEQSKFQDRELAVSEHFREFGIIALPASLGDHTGLGGELGWAPRQLGHRLRVDVNATTHQYNRERVTGALGPVSAIYASEWLPRELYYGPGLGAPLAGKSAYGERPQSATKVRRSAPLMFRDRSRARGPMHRTWVSAWAGPRAVSVTRGRDPDSPSFESVHPLEAAASLDRSIEQFAYGVGFSHDARSGIPRWSQGWRASIDAERYDRSIPGLALNDAHSSARSFTRLTLHAETGVSFGMDPRTLRLAITAVNQQADAAGGTFLLGDLQSLGGSAGLAGFVPGRFRDLDLVLAKLAYLFPLVKNLEVELHTESGGVYPALRPFRIASLESTFGAALRVRTTAAVLGALGCDWSSEAARVWIAVGGIE